MSTKETGGAAFPSSPTIGPNDQLYRPVDIGCDGMTLRQYAAIKLKVPDSGEDWLDSMILAALRNDFAGKAMQSLISHHGAYCDDTTQYGAVGREDVFHVDQVAGYAYTQADAMLEARK